MDISCDGMIANGNSVIAPMVVEHNDIILEENLTQLCRLCGNCSNQLMSIFTGDGADHNLPNKIKEHIPFLEVTENDVLPSNVCYQCASTLISWHELYYVCKDADVRMRQMRDKLIEKGKKLVPTSSDTGDNFVDCTIIDSDDEPETIFESDKLVLGSEIPLLMSSSTSVAVASTLGSSFIQPEKNAVIKTSSTPAEMNRCTSATDAMHNNEESLSYVVSGGDESALLVFDSKCSLCSLCYADVKEDGKYLNGVLLCAPCCQQQCERTSLHDFQIMALNEGDAITDPKLIRVLGEERTYVRCERCFVLCEASEFDAHWLTHVVGDLVAQSKTVVATWRCDHCPKVFERQDELVAHVKSHAAKPQPQYRCEVCDKNFKSDVHLRNHRKRHVGTPINNSTLIYCERCKKYFKTKKGFAYHQEKICMQYKCYVCDETFPAHSALQEHLKSRHENDDDDEQRRRLLETVPTIKGGDNETVMSACPVCGKVVTQAVLPRHMVLHNEERPFVCDGCGKRFKRKHALQDHIMIEMGMKNYVCDVCGMKFLKQGYLNKHVRFHKLSNGEFQGFACEQCGKKFSEKWRLGVHQRAVHKGGKFASCKCDICDRLFAERWMVKLHKHKEHNGEAFEEYHCDVCGKKFLEKWMMQSHVRTTHRNGVVKKTYCDLCGRTDHEADECQHRHSAQVVECLLCNESFASNVILKKHVNAVHNFVEKRRMENVPATTEDDGKNVVHMCAGCDKYFYSKPELVQHQTKEKCYMPLKYECSECGRGYTSKFSLRNHMMSHEKAKAHYEFHCEFCDKRFATAASLANHLSLDKICLLCDKVYACNNQLKNHVFGEHADSDAEEQVISLAPSTSQTNAVAAEEERVYKCKLCGKCFSRKQSMKNHLFAEMNLRRFVCEFCDKSYNYYSHLKEHLITSHGEREYLCVHCGKDFPTRKRYRDHVTLHSEEKPFQCQCGVSFKLFRYLCKHKKHCKMLQDEMEER